MELKAGYQQTEVGVIPEDWDCNTIRDLSKMITVGFVGSMAHLFRRQGVPLLRGQNVLPGKLDLRDPRYIDKQTHTLWRKSALQPGDVVLVRVGYPGTCAKIPEGIGEANAASLVVIRPDTQDIDSDFLCYVLLSPIGKKQIDASLVGGAQQVINIGTAAELQIPVPPTIAEQEAIAEALSDADALIDSLEQLIAKKRRVKQGAMQDLLTGKKRLPGFEGEWERFAVGQKGKVVTGKALAIRAPGEPRPYLRTKNVFDGRIEIDDVLTMPMTDEQFEHFKVRRGDVLLNEGQSLELVGRCAIYRGEYPEPCVIQNQLLRFRANSKTSALFASYLFRYCQRTGVFAAIALQTTSIAHLGGSRFEALRLDWPPTFAEQTAIAAVLSDMDAEIAALEAKLAKARQVKQGMMQELLTGKTRLV